MAETKNEHGAKMQHKGQTDQAAKHAHEYTLKNISWCVVGVRAFIFMEETRWIDGALLMSLYIFFSSRSGSCYRSSRLGPR
jgi:hypothetical protein